MSDTDNIGRHLTEQAVREWRLTFDAITDAVSILDSGFNIVRANRAALDLVHLSDEEQLVGQPCFGLFAGREEPCEKCPITLARASGLAQRMELEHQHLGRSFAVSVAPLFEADTLIGYVHVAKDMTPQRKLERQLVQAQKMEAIATLAGGIAHDFNNILGAILGNVDLLLYRFRQERLGSNEVITREELQEALEEVRRAGRRAAELVQQVLAFSRQGRSQKQSLMIAPVVKEAVKLLRSSLPTTIEVKLALGEDLCQVQADPSQVHQVLMNLCTNAAHAMRPRGGELDIKLAMVHADEEYCRNISELSPGSYVAMSVQDTGHGMPAEVIERIFDPFFTTKEVGEGTGLGLSVIHGVMVDHGGAIQVQSKVNVGSTFTVYWPCMATAVEVVKDRQAWVLEGGNERILFVDDEEEIVRVRKRMLQYLGYQVETAFNGVEAEQLFRENPERFDLLITDQTMPRMTGLELARLVHEKRPDMAIILCSGYSAAVPDEDARLAGIGKFLRKPLDMRVLAAVMRELLDRKS
ncbi:MAG: hypothetical protein BWK76_09230 [Desulfobulbaceae bacterium A2]|nr:MAG: hypothetical protein BWK76_09230 [Desulfobulbaceae bacterium A2]